MNICMFCIQLPIQKQLGTHLESVTRKGEQIMEEIPNKFVYIPLLESLEQILQNHAIQTQVTNKMLILRNLFYMQYLVTMQVMSGPHQMVCDVCDGQLFKEHQIFSTNDHYYRVF